MSGEFWGWDFILGWMILSEEDFVQEDFSVVDFVWSRFCLGQVLSGTGLVWGKSCLGKILSGGRGDLFCSWWDFVLVSTSIPLVHQTLSLL